MTGVGQCARHASLKPLATAARSAATNPAVRAHVQQLATRGPSLPGLLAAGRALLTRGGMAPSRMQIPIGPLRRVIGTAAGPAVDAGSTKALGAWMATVSGAVFGMVAVGGYTRLTRSGLSMTEWRPQGSRLPSGLEEWTVAFDKYKATPEYRKLNQSMNLEEFKSIYFWEWFHRMWGRSLGVIFVVPLVYFVARKRTRAALSNAGMFPRMATLFLLGGTQGLVGWWMVKSGLEHTHILGFERSEHDMPRVSPYRLATHLSFAFVTYGLLCWTTMDLYSASIKSNVEAAIATSPDVLRRLGRLRNGMVATASIVGLTVISGAFVAGNLAGLAYNDWPLMAGKFVPAGISEEWDRFNPPVRNLFENIAMVQFDHRILAYTTLAVTTTMFFAARGLKGHLPANVMFRAKLLTSVVWAQATLGVVTILMYVPVELGVLHQAGALTAWTASLWLLHSVRFVKVAARAAKHVR